MPFPLLATPMHDPDNQLSKPRADASGPVRGLGLMLGWMLLGALIVGLAIGYGIDSLCGTPAVGHVGDDTSQLGRRHAALIPEPAPMNRTASAITALGVPAVAGLATGLVYGGTAGGAIVLGSALALPLLLISGVLTFAVAGPLWAVAMIGVLGSFLVRIGGAGVIAIAVYQRSDAQMIMMSLSACLLASLLIEMGLWLRTLRPAAIEVAHG